VAVSRLAAVGGTWSEASYDGAFRVVVSRSASSAYADVVARLMYL
jgi:hypothetical protein